MPAPSNLKVTDDQFPTLFWLALTVTLYTGALLFNIVKQTPTKATQPGVSIFSTSTSHTFYNLPNEKRFWFQVAAVGTRKQIKFSDIKSRIAQ